MAARSIIWLRLITILLAAGLTTGAGAQQATVAQSAILTVDSERVFSTTIAGRQITEDLEVRLEALVRENRQIEAELVAEELDLTEKRKTMEPVAFRALADAFDVKVQKIRAEQDAKQRELQRLRDAERQSFVDQIAPILSGIGRERGAVIILERRNVLLSADNIDITEEAIARINLALAQQNNADAVADQNPPANAAAGAPEGTGSQ